MSFGFKDIGTFESEDAAVRWARANNVSMGDLKTSPHGSNGQVQASIRSEADKGGWSDRSGDRGGGFF